MMGTVALSHLERRVPQTFRSRADGGRPNRANTSRLSRPGRPFDRLVRQSTGDLLQRDEVDS